MAANIGGLKGILEFSKNAHVNIFHYISTAFVAGTDDTYCREILSATKTFTNVYEESKAGAVSKGGIFNLTTNSPTNFETLASFNEQFMKVRGMAINYGKAIDMSLRNPAEELFDRFIEPYRPYLSDNRSFDRTNTDMVTDGLTPPEFTYEIFKTCMEFAIGVKWGALTFT